MLILQHTIVRRTKEMLAGGLRMLLPLTLTGAGAKKKKKKKKQDYMPQLLASFEA